MGNRVYCLYRVSTIGQVEKNDIPMQKQACREFAEQNGWDILKEFTEKGVSGFKVSAKDRDAVQEIQKDATLGKFDILLVFMFDRLGRKEDETPFVVEWFVRNGIEVWSTQEGQQRFDNHVDKLMNYIRYWQASGESIKTSIRTKTRLAQIIQEGRFRGGVAPYGYKLVKNGRMGKKNREMYDIEVDELEAPVVRKIFDLSSKYGYGSRRIASILKDEGILNRNGEMFHYSSIQGMLKNIMYLGILRSGETQSDVFPSLQIVDPDIFARVKEMLAQRARNYEGQLKIPKKIMGKALLSGNIYCGHCGGRMFATTGQKSRNNVERVPIYKCYNRSQYRDLCNGPTTYQATRIDNAIKEMLSEIFLRVKGVDEQKLVNQTFKGQLHDVHTQLRAAKEAYDSKVSELSKLDELLIDASEGNSDLTPGRLMRRMDTVEKELANYDIQVQKLQSQLDEGSLLLDKIQKDHQQMVSWAEVFMDANPDTQKLIASSLIEAVRISKDYELEVEFSIDEQQYNMGLSI